MTRARLRESHPYFYHFTVSSNRASLQSRGIDPAFEHPDSGYAPRSREPGKAMRYCTKKGWSVGLNAALTKRLVWEPKLGLMVPNQDDIVVLRTLSTSLLDRRFGLDYSFSRVAAPAEEILSSGELSVDQFVAIVEQSSCISCYESISVDELEVQIGDVVPMNGCFIPLTSW